MIMKRRGKFLINRVFMQDRENIALAVLRNCLVVRAEHLFCEDSVEYVACHSDFDEVPINQITPNYTAEISMQDSNEFSINWIKDRTETIGWNSIVGDLFLKKDVAT